jgi:hypothetical protein
VVVTSDGDKVITGGKNHQVKVFSFKDMEYISTVTRLTAAVTHIAIDSSDNVM